MLKTDAWFLRQVKSLKPRYILDIGAGFGERGRALRQALIPVHRLHAVEIWPTYVTQYELNRVYDSIVVKDVVDLDTKFFIQYDLVLVGKVLQYLDKDSAEKLWNKIKGAKAAIVYINHEDVENDGNPYKFLNQPWNRERFIEDFGPFSAAESFDKSDLFVARFRD